MPNYQFQAIIEQDETGGYVGEVPALPACYTQGDTIEELLENLREVIAMCLEELKEEGKTIPTSHDIRIETIDVAV